MMRVFICKLCKLLILLFSLLLIFWGVIIHNRAEICKIDANILFLGNSRVQYGIDDRLIPEHLMQDLMRIIMFFRILN